MHKPDPESHSEQHYLETTTEWKPNAMSTEIKGKRKKCQCGS